MIDCQSCVTRGSPYPYPYKDKSFYICFPPVALGQSTICLNILQRQVVLSSSCIHIPDICLGHHRQCPCKKSVRLKAKSAYFTFLGVFLNIWVRMYTYKSFIRNIRNVLHHHQHLVYIMIIDHIIYDDIVHQRTTISLTILHYHHVHHYFIILFSSSVNNLIILYCITVPSTPHSTVDMYLSKIRRCCRNNSCDIFSDLYTTMRKHIVDLRIQLDTLNYGAFAYKL